MVEATNIFKLKNDFQRKSFKLSKIGLAVAVCGFIPSIQEAEADSSVS